MTVTNGIDAPCCEPLRAALEEAGQDFFTITEARRHHEHGSAQSRFLDGGSPRARDKPSPPVYDDPSFQPRREDPL